MSENERKQVNRPRNRRITIGLVIDNLYGVGAYQGTLWKGVAEAAEQYDAHLICYSGGTLGYSPYNEFEYQINIVYDIVNPNILDGLVLVSGTMGNYISPEEFKTFYSRYVAMPIPVVSIGRQIEGANSLVLDNAQGLRDAIAHLIQEHGYRRIAFIRGPEGNADAEQRYRVYTEMLAAHGIPLDPTLVAPGNFLPVAGVQAVSLLLDERKADFEVIVAANDNMALGAIEALQARGLVVPYDKAVIGFDDLAPSRFTNPPLTTVRQPVYEEGRKAVEIVIARLAGETPPAVEQIPTQLVVRHSCGCLQPMLPATDTAFSTTPTLSPDIVLTTQREQILSGLIKAIQSPALEQRAIVEWATRLLDAFTAELKDKQAFGAFPRVLDEALRQVTRRGIDPSGWYGAIAVLRRYLLPHLDHETLPRAISMWENAWVIIGEAGQRVQAQLVQQMDTWSETLRDVSQALIASFDTEKLAAVAAQQLPRLGIRECYASLYENREDPTTWSRLVWAYNENGPIQLSEEARRFPTLQLGPDCMLSEDRRHHFLVSSLYFREERLGTITFGVEMLNGLAYETLRAQISSALKGALLVQELETRSRALQEANYALQRRAIELETSAEVARAITSIFDIDELLRRAVNLIKERFGFYHAGIFLLDETGRWAVLKEATGEVGAQMKAQGHRLQVGETSMVGWTAYHRQPRIALDVGKDAVRFAHPLLPHTRSEMTLPLMVGDELLGVLNIQSEEEAAFDQDDVRALQSMANQLSIAIENARRISDEATLLEMTSPIYRASRLLTTATATHEVANAIIESVVETGADGCLVVQFELSPTGEPTALLYLGVWRRDREPQYKAGMRLPIEDSPFPIELVSTLWAATDVEKDKRLPESAKEVFRATGARALVNIPLHSGDKVIGQVVVLRDTPGPFPEAALRLYEVLSDQAAVALERAQLLEEAQRRAEREAQTRQMIDRIRRSMDMTQALQVTAESLAQALQVPHVTIELSLEQE